MVCNLEVGESVGCFIFFEVYSLLFFKVYIFLCMFFVLKMNVKVMCFKKFYMELEMCIEVVFSLVLFLSGKRNLREVWNKIFIFFEFEFF